MSRATGATYDVIDRADSMLPNQVISPLEAAATLVGTYDATTVITDLFMPPSATSVKISGASMKRTTGGTAADTAPAWGLAYSLAGTGDSTVFGTLLWGTIADNLFSDFSVTETSIDPGYVVELVGLVGTTDTASEVGSLLLLQYKEDWN